jgi:hypothetical protein
LLLLLFAFVNVDAFIVAGLLATRLKTASTTLVMFAVSELACLVSRPGDSCSDATALAVKEPHPQRSCDTRSKRAFPQTRDALRATACGFSISRVPWPGCDSHASDVTTREVLPRDERTRRFFGTRDAPPHLTEVDPELDAALHAATRGANAASMARDGRMAKWRARFEKAFEKGSNLKVELLI